MTKIFQYIIAVGLVVYALQNEVEEPRKRLLDQEKETSAHSKDSPGFSVVYKLMEDIISLKYEIKAMENKLEDLKADQATNLFKLEQRVAKLERQQLEGVSIKCHDKTTAWDQHGGGDVVYLDRQQVQCSQQEVLSYFHLQRNRERDRVRYEYKCCSIK